MQAGVRVQDLISMTHAAVQLLELWLQKLSEHRFKNTLIG